MEKVRERLRRAAAALEKANIRYAVAGGNSVAAWVSRVDEAAVRNTQAIDILYLIQWPHQSDEIIIRPTGGYSLIVDFLEVQGLL